MSGPRRSVFCYGQRCREGQIWGLLFPMTRGIIKDVNAYKGVAMNIYDIAQRAGVSIATVSRVMNGNSHVSEATRSRVLAVIDEMGFTPSVHARSLGKGSMKTIGVLCADASDLFLAQAVNHIEGLLRSEGYHALLCCTGHALENKRRAIKLLLGKQVDALLLVGSQFQEAEDNRHILQAARQVPVVLINGALHGGNLACVRIDHRQATYRATRKLIGQGRRVLYLHDSLTHSGREKLEGYQQAVREAGMEPPVIMRCRREVESARAVSRRLLQAMGSRLSGVVASEDILAIGALKAAKEAGLAVPRQVSLIGFNNSILCQCCQPELSSVDSRVELLCREAVARVMDMLAGRPAERDTILEGIYVGRGTTHDDKEEQP